MTEVADGDPNSPAAGARRPIKARSSRWASALANELVRRNVKPNTISMASVAFAAVGALGLVLTRAEVPPWLAGLLYLLAIVGIQGRLICNLLDGMVAVEGGKGGPTGEVFNDLPDRLADPILLAAAGYGIGITTGVELGWLAAIGAILTAYVRVLGRSIGAGTYFLGPMAKQHRMALLTAACVVAAVVAWFHDSARRWVMYGALLLIVVGCVFTILRRLGFIFRDMRAKGAKL
ncbi:CDP-alcohol phosphatidyltransferase family protein [Humisphaera borealis]|uniref:CDP-alcohol phosphatidyltransferase family protein n=1 Tax=Humisphaera borealis TaxID=2807512 RepID=A0A7M2WXE8_9BACT|nr:CDP-alcohol phosphatidyltransferase family protein [Humisphaera borealis]QOV89872.1 CDP-alcohol phosphatidyltransferase family protein [Humisphaera borealis]